MNRSSHRKVLCKKGALRHFTKFPRKHLCRSVLFHKVATLHPVTLFKKHFGTDAFKNTFLTEFFWAAASKYNVTFKEIFSLIELEKENIA